MLLTCVKVKDLLSIWRHQQRNKTQWLAKGHNETYRQSEASEVTLIPVKLSKTRSMTTKAIFSLLLHPFKITRGLLSVMMKSRAITCLGNSNLLKLRSIKNNKFRKRTMKTHLIIYKLKIQNSWTTSNKRMLKP